MGSSGLCRGLARSGIFFSPTLEKFHDPGSRFCVLAKHRSAFRVPHEQCSSIVLPGTGKGSGKHFVFPWRKAGRFSDRWKTVGFQVVPGVGLEPTRPCGQEILSLSWLPLHHPGLSCLRAIYNTLYKVLATSFKYALNSPLTSACFSAKSTVAFK